MPDPGIVQRVILQMAGLSNAGGVILQMPVNLIEIFTLRQAYVRTIGGLENFSKSRNYRDFESRHGKTLISFEPIGVIKN